MEMPYPLIVSAYRIYNGDHAELEREYEGVKPEDRPDWPLPSFDARDWAKALKGEGDPLRGL
jgi:hypothetical protein